jgi:Histidine kinase-, DNA gyrase B-, and HSP90-like ATPase
MSNLLNGFDPLEITADTGAGPVNSTVFEEATKRVIHNILRSYTGFYDVFSEAIQNSLDAVELAARQRGKEYRPLIWITIDIPGSRFRIVDNGIGMTADEFKYCFRPNVSYKKGANVRGEKGVGATFLAYGFSFISLQSKKSGERTAAILRQGRQWADDERGVFQRPRFESQDFDVPELAEQESGTCVEIKSGRTPGERPRDFNWISAQNAQQWFDVLRIKTPLGAIYLSGSKFSARIHLSVISSEGNTTERVSDRVEYFYPHEIPDLKVQALEDIVAAQNKIPGDATTKLKNLPQEFKRLDCVYSIWDKDVLLAEDSDFASTLQDESNRALIERHRIVVYAAFLSTAKTWTALNDDVIKLRKGLRIIHGGLQLASDNMPQGDLSVIPLTSAIGYQNNTHVIVHFNEGSPDMGRKVFQPELTQLAESLAVRAVTIFRRYLGYLRPDSGAPTITPDRELYEWKKDQEKFRDDHPLSMEINSHPISLLSYPRQEQDVVGLFHELIGAGVLRGFRFFGTSSSDRYDSVFMMDYSPDDSIYFQVSNNKLGIDRDYPTGK